MSLPHYCTTREYIQGADILSAPNRQESSFPFPLHYLSLSPVNLHSLPPVSCLAHKNYVFNISSFFQIWTKRNWTPLKLFIQGIFDLESKGRNYELLDQVCDNLTSIFLFSAAFDAYFIWHTPELRRILFF